MREQKLTEERRPVSLRWSLGAALAYSLAMAAFAVVAFPDLLAAVQRRPLDPAALWRNLLPGLMALFGLAGAALIWSGRHHPSRQALGAWVLVLSMLFGALAGNLMVQGYGLLLGVLVLLVGAILADQLLMDRPLWHGGISQGALMLLLSALAAGACVLIDFFWPGPRPAQDPGEGQAAAWLTAGFAGLFILYLAARYRSYRLATKIALGFLFVALIVGLIIGAFSLTTSSRNLTANAGSAVLSLAESQRRAVGDSLARQIDGLNVLAFNHYILENVLASNDAYPPDPAAATAQVAALDERWRQAVADGNLAAGLIQRTLRSPAATEIDEYGRQFPENVEIFVTDRYGAVIAASGPTTDYNQADEHWWQAAWNGGTGAIYLGPPEYDESSRTLSLILAMPVVDEAGRLVGVIRTTIEMDYLRDLISLARIGQRGEADLLFPSPAAESGLAGFHGDEFIALPEAEAGNLRQLASASSTEPYGRLPVDDIDSLASLRPVVASAVGHPEVDALGWQVLAHQPVDEALAALQTQTRLTLLLVLGAMLLAALSGLGLARLLAGPVVRLTAVARQVEAGDLQAQARVETLDEVGELATAFNSMTGQVSALVGSLEQRVDERTRALQASFDVSQHLATLLEPRDLLTAIVDDVVQAFDYYHAQVYLLEAHPDGRHLVLASGTGEAGQTLLQRRHSLPIGRGLVGRAAAQNQPVLAADTAADPGWLPNPLLPETRSEAAVPLAIGDEVLGVLDVQHRLVNGLGQQDLQLLLAIASQAALAVQNARSFQQARLQAEREALLNRLARSLQSAPSAQAGLQTALEELSRRLQASAAWIEIHPGDRSADGRAAGSRPAGTRTAPRPLDAAAPGASDPPGINLPASGEQI